jgi:hypothetical protein
VARAKRTDRADARRRYRQYQTTDLDEAGVDGDAAPPNVAPSPRVASTQPERPSITAAFRNAYHPAHVREDLRYLPMLLRSRAFLGALALVGVGMVSVIVAPDSPVSAFLFQALVYPPAMAPIFIVGFFARRASYLLGLILAVVDVAAFAVVVNSLAPAPGAVAVDRAQLVLSAITTGPLSGVFFAAAAAWYRRFLALSNAGASQRARARQQQRAKEQQRARAGKPARS